MSKEERRIEKVKPNMLKQVIRKKLLICENYSSESGVELRAIWC